MDHSTATLSSAGKPFHAVAVLHEVIEQEMRAITGATAGGGSDG